MDGEQTNIGGGTSPSPITRELRHCSQCGAFGNSDDHYCSGCGASYANACSQCGAEIRNSEALYCTVCGNRIQSLK